MRPFENILQDIIEKSSIEENMFTVHILNFLFLLSLGLSVNPETQKMALSVAKTRLRHRGDGKSSAFSNLKISRTPFVFNDLGESDWFVERL